MKLSVVIVHFNTSADLGRCLDALERCPPACEHAVTVVDNASTDPGLAAVRAAHPGARWLMNDRNEGYARGCNRGLRAVDAEYVLLLNPDVVAQPGAIDALLRVAEAHPRAGLLGPQLLNEDGTIQESCRRFYTLGTLLMRRTPLGRLAPRSRAVARHLMRDFDHRTTRPVDWVIGGCVLVRREAVTRVGAMDERFFLYFEDVDWCYRMGQAGYDVLYAPESRFVHRHRRDSAGGPMRRSFWLHLGSLISFYEKWGLLVYLLKRWRDPLGTFAFWLTDLVALNLSLLAAYALRGALNPFFDEPLLPLAWYRPLFVFANLLTSLGFLLLGRYRRDGRGRTSRAGERMQQVAAVTLLLWASTYMSHQHIYSRVVLLLFWPLLLGTLLLSESAFLALRRRMERGYLSLERTLLVGPAAVVGEWLDGGPDPRSSGLDAVGYLSTEAAARGLAPDGPDVPRLGAPADLVDVVERYRIAQVVFWQWPTGETAELRALARLRRRRVRLRWRVDAAALLQAGAHAEEFGGAASAVLDPGPARPVRDVARRLAAAGLGLLLWPLSTPAAGLARLRRGWAMRDFPAAPAGEDSLARNWRLLCGRDGRPCGLLQQPALARALIGGSLALAGDPLVPCRPGGAPPPSGAVGDPWRLEPPVAGLSGAWAGAGPTRFRRALRDPAGISRLARGTTEQENP